MQGRYRNSASSSFASISVLGAPRPERWLLRPGLATRNLSHSSGGCSPGVDPAPCCALDTAAAVASMSNAGAGRRADVPVGDAHGAKPPPDGDGAVDGVALASASSMSSSSRFRLRAGVRVPSWASDASMVPVIIIIGTLLDVVMSNTGRATPPVDAAVWAWLLAAPLAAMWNGTASADWPRPPARV